MLKKRVKELSWLLPLHHRDQKDSPTSDSHQRAGTSFLLRNHLFHRGHKIKAIYIYVKHNLLFSSENRNCSICLLFQKQEYKISVQQQSPEGEIILWGVATVTQSNVSRKAGEN